MTISRLPHYAALIVCLALAACGGSGSSNTSSSASSGGGGADSGGSSSGGGSSGGSGTGSGGSGTADTACGTNTTNTGQLVIGTTSCPAGVQGTAYAGCTITASGGTPPYHYCVASAAANPPLPEGMVLNSTTGAISSTLVGGQGYYGTKIIVTDSASPNNMATQVIGFSIQGNNAFLSSVFASNSIFHHRIDSLPVDTSPAAAMNAPTAKLQPNFGNLFNTPWPFGMPAISVPSSQTAVAVTTTLYNSGFAIAPIPSYAPVEAWNNGNTDRHVIVYQLPGASTPGSLYEMYQGTLQSNGSWTDSSNAAWVDVVNNVMTPLAPAAGAGTTLASGLPNAATIVNADEVIGTGTPSAPNGSVQHPIRLVLAHVLDYYVWPATATSNVASTSTCSKNGVTITAGTRLSQSAPPTSCAATGPFGQMYRLKSTVPNPSCAASSPQASIIITGLREYGVIIGDISSNGGLWGTPDSRWNDYDLACLQQLTLGDFEPVNVSSLMVSATSFQTQ